MNTWTNIVTEKVHKHSNTTNVLTTEQKGFWKLSNIILHIIYRLWFFQTPQSQSMILKFLWYIQSVLWLPSYSVRNRFPPWAIRYCRAEQQRRGVILWFSKFHFFLLFRGKAVFSLHALRGRLGLGGLSAVSPRLPRALQGQRFLLVHHDVIDPLVCHAAARATALLLRTARNKLKWINSKKSNRVSQTDAGQAPVPLKGPTLPLNNHLRNGISEGSFELQQERNICLPYEVGWIFLNLGPDLNIPLVYLL